jgi:hypothetical protein
MMQWLSTTDFPAQQHDIITRRQRGTGQWFLDCSEFKRWLQGSEKTLYCPGIPGAGKAMIAAIAIDHLCRTILSDDIGVVYLFCSYKAQTDQNAESLLAALLKQLVQSRPDIAAPVTNIYKDHSKRRSRPSPDQIFQVLQSVCTNYSAVHVIVDALDECANEDGSRDQLIDKLQKLQTGTDIRLLFTSRSISEITQQFCWGTIVEVRATKEDVTKFVEGQIPSLPKCIQRDDELNRAVKTRIVDAVDGM